MSGSCQVVPCAISRALQSPAESAQERELGTMQCCAFVPGLCYDCARLRFLSVAVVPHCSLVLHALLLQTGAHGNWEISNHKNLFEGSASLVSLLQSLNSGTFSSEWCLASVQDGQEMLG